MREVFIRDAVRTPVGKLGGALAGTRPDDLAATVVRALAERHDLERLDEVYFGDANQAGEDNRNVARMAVLLAGLPTSIPGATLNRLCGSGMEAAFSASRAIAAGDEDSCVAGGVEAMSRAPWVMLKPDKPFPRGSETMHSTTLGWRMVNPEMPDEWTVTLGEGAEILADKYGITREQQDEFALKSHQKAAAAWDRGAFADEVIAMEELERDESIRADTTLEKLATLKPVFRKDGTVTAGNSSPMNDGASALLAVGRRRRRAGADREPRLERRRAAALRDRAGRGGEQGARAGGHRLGRPDGGRAQRGVRCPVARVPGRVEGARPRDRQRQRRRDRARARARQLRHAAADHARARAAPARRWLGAGGHVHRRRTGHRDGGRGMTGYRRDVDTHPAYLSPDYRSTVRRAPDKPLIILPHTLSEITGPVYGHERVGAARPRPHAPARRRAARRADHRDRPRARRRRPPGAATRWWRSGSATRPAATSTARDQHPAPLDPNFTGAGRTITDDEGRYRFVTIKPGAYPWGNHDNAWRPAHIHFSLFGTAFATRLVTQMYFPGDPLFGHDPIFQSVRDPKARERMIAGFDLGTTESEWALGYQFDIVLRGREATPMET